MAGLMLYTVPTGALQPKDLQQGGNRVSSLVIHTVLIQVSNNINGGGGGDGGG